MIKFNKIKSNQGCYFIIAAGCTFITCTCAFKTNVGNGLESYLQIISSNYYDQSISFEKKIDAAIIKINSYAKRDEEEKHRLAKLKTISSDIFKYENELIQIYDRDSDGSEPKENR